MPTTIKELFGAPYSVLTDVGNGVASLTRGDALKGTEQLSPRFVASPICGIREATEGVTTSRNEPVYCGTERLRADWYDALLRSLSFNPAELSNKREQQWKEHDADREYRDRRTDIYTAMRRVLLNGGSKGEWADMLLDVEAYNAAVHSSIWPDLPLITPASIKALKTKIDKPSGREKRRGQAE